MYEHSYKLEEFLKGLVVVYVEASWCLPIHNGFYYYYWVIDVVP
jgi:hypothetical protein